MEELSIFNYQKNKYKSQHFKKQFSIGTDYYLIKFDD